MLGVHVDQVGVDHRQDLRQHLEDGHLRAQSSEHGRELHPDHAPADDREPRGLLFEFQDAIRVDRQLRALKRYARHRRPGGDDDVLGRDRLAADDHFPIPAEPGRSLERLDAARLEQTLDTLDELVDHRALALLRHGPVEADLARDQAERLAALRLRVQLGRLQERLGRDAATHEARAAHAVLLDDGCGRSELRGPECCHIAAGAAADDHYIKRSCHRSRLRLDAGHRRYVPSALIMPVPPGASRWADRG